MLFPFAHNDFKCLPAVIFTSYAGERFIIVLSPNLIVFCSISFCLYQDGFAVMYVWFVCCLVTLKEVINQFAQNFMRRFFMVNVKST